jgi:hypothetical protein
MRELSVCAIVKDETPYLVEWVEFHRLVGVEHFHIYDNGSRIPVSQTLARQISEGVVDAIDFPGVDQHLPAYGHYIINFANASEWVAFIDADEFLFPTVVDDLRQLIREYKDHAGLVVNWVPFGSSGHLERPAGLQIENFNKRASTTHDRAELVKSIIKTKYSAGSYHTHCFPLIPGHTAVNEHGKVVPYGPRSAPNSIEKVRINHYFTRSRAEFAEKISRGRSDGTRLLDIGDFTGADAVFNEVEDKTIHRFIPALKKRMGMTS